MDIDRRAHDQSRLDAAVPARSRSCVVFRPVGTIRREHRSRVPHRRGGDPMMPGDPYLLVRAVSLYVTVVLTVAAWAVRRPTARDMSGGVLACLWNLPTLMALNLAAAHYGWWTFD